MKKFLIEKRTTCKNFLTEQVVERFKAWVDYSDGKEFVASIIVIVLLLAAAVGGSAAYVVNAKTKPIKLAMKNTVPAKTYEAWTKEEQQRKKAMLKGSIYDVDAGPPDDTPPTGTPPPKAEPVTLASAKPPVTPVVTPPVPNPPTKPVVVPPTPKPAPKLVAAVVVPQPAVKRPVVAPVIAPAPIVIPDDFVDADKNRHHFVRPSETLGAISTKEYGSSMFATDIAWINPRVKSPDLIVVGQEIVLPYSINQFPVTPENWPNAEPTPEELAMRGQFPSYAEIAASMTDDATLHEETTKAVIGLLDLKPAVTETAPAVSPTPENDEWTLSAAVAPDASTPCTVKTRLGKIAETWWTIARDEYKTDDTTVGLTLATMNNVADPGQSIAGVRITLPCLEVVNPFARTLTFDTSKASSNVGGK